MSLAIINSIKSRFKFLANNYDCDIMVSVASRGHYIFNYNKCVKCVYNKLLNY